MNRDELDASLAALLTPPSSPPDRIFAAQIDSAIGDLERLRVAENWYARGLVRDVVALVAAVAGGGLLARAHLVAGASASDWLATLPAALLLLVLVGGSRQVRNQGRTGSSAAP